MNFITEKFNYRYGGFGNTCTNIIAAGISNRNDTAQWTRCNATAKYGTYEWNGKIIDNHAEYGWGIQGLASKDSNKYVAFEFICSSRMRCMVYDKYISHTKWLFFVPPLLVRKHEIWMDEVKYNNSWRFDYLDWLKYKIVWKEGVAKFYINDSLVAKITKFVPKEEDNLFFNINVGASPSQPVPGKPLVTMAKDIKLD